MTARNFSLLAAVIFAVIAVVQLMRAISGLEVVVGGEIMPVWPSWIAFLVTGALAYLGYTASRN